MENSADYERFLTTFARTKGAVELLVITSLLSLGIGVTVGLVPSEMADRYARLHYDYDGAHCSFFGRLDKPEACQDGSDDAQEASTWSNVWLCVLLLLCSPVIGSVSDSQGRRNLILWSLLLAILPAAAFVLLLYLPNMTPFWYYAANSIAGAISTISLVFAALSDVMPKNLRAPAFGFVMAGYYGGFAFGPTCAVFLNPLDSALLSASLLLLALAIGLLFLPETRSDEALLQARLEMTLAPSNNDDHDALLDDTRTTWLLKTATRPLRNVAILNRNWTLRLLTAGSFFSAMVFAADSTLVIYYIENHLGIQTEDLAEMFMVLGVFGIICQGGLLQPLTEFMGEKPLLVAAFGCGVCHNLVYGVAKTKYGIMLAFVVSQLTKLNFPLLSSLASRGASAHEQGKVQGALFATNAIANALGPLIMEYIYRRTEYSSDLGPGFMWIFAAFLYFIGTVLVSLIPMDANSPRHPGEECLLSTERPSDCDEEGSQSKDDGLETPFLAPV